MALTDWGKVSNGSGFNNDGTFSNGSTSLLPWPKFTVNGGVYDVAGIDLTSSLALDDVRSSLPNPYEAGSFFTVSGNNLGHFINKHNFMGEIEWTYDCKNIWSSHDEVHIHHFYDDGTTKWLLGSMRAVNNYWSFFKIDIDGIESMKSAQFHDNSTYFRGMTTLEDNSLYYTVNLAGEGFITYETNISTLMRGQQIEGVGYHKSNVGVSLFNGSVIMLRNGFGNEHAYDVVVTTFAVNSNLSSTGVAKKCTVSTPHELCLNAFSYIYQLSKDIFFSSTAPDSLGFHNKFFNRTELESWVSNSIFAVTGFRLQK
ncbi:hypothetical protein [Pseudoalteromonas sp. PS5]|uniref:hypothetical protein n=1 Tax=Pseudoalteromonas sp. PS5 TaxID=1437473 RepID=UPI000FFF55E7|nr:hypothetical protein [Pseudoalteromonas sp. PS5]RXE99586.1 hypothetical protein D9603_16365 [Pseudoalteromonas sp. PS5]